MTPSAHDRKAGSRVACATRSKVARRRWQQGQLAILIALPLAIVSACGRSDEALDPETTLVPVTRFVDQAPPGWRTSIRAVVYEALRQLGGVRPLRTIDIPTATIGDDTRYVLRAPPKISDTIPLADWRIEADRRLLDFPLPDSFVGSTHGVVRAAAWAGVHWSDADLQGPFAVKKVHGDALAITIVLPEADIAPGATHIFVEVFGGGDALTTRTRSWFPGARG